MQASKFVFPPVPKQSAKYNHPAGFNPWHNRKKEMKKYICPGCEKKVPADRMTWCDCNPSAPFRMMPLSNYEFIEKMIKSRLKNPIKKKPVEGDVAKCGEVKWDRFHDTGNNVYTGQIHITQDGKKTLCNRPIPKDDYKGGWQSWKWDVDWGKGSKRFAKEFGGSDFSKTGFPNIILEYSEACSCCSKRSKGAFDKRPATW